MKQQLALASALLLSLSLSACGGGEVEGGAGAGDGAPAMGGGSDLPAPATEADEGMVAYVEGFREMAEAVKGVKDEATAKAAAEKLGAITTKLSAMGEELGALSDEEMSAASMRYSGALQAAQTELSQAMMPLVTKPDLAKHLSEAMKSLPKPPAQ